MAGCKLFRPCVGNFVILSVNLKTFVMKRLQLKALELGAEELLQRDQLKSVLGGYGAPCTSHASCPAGQRCTILLVESRAICMAVPFGASCTSDADCGNGQRCRRYTGLPNSGGYCTRY